MHQIFYIDIDEEITSIVDRLYKSKSNDVYFVIPKNALILQSGIGLKLLKKEGMRVRKRISLITQDYYGKIRAEKAGLRILNSTEELDGATEIIEEKVTKEKKEDFLEVKNKKFQRLQTIGSENFFGKNEEVKPKTKASRMEKSEIKKDGFLVTENIKTDVAHEMEDENLERDRQLEEIFSLKKEARKNENKNKDEFESEAKKISPRPQVVISGAMKKVFIAFILLSILVFFGAVFFIFAPRATVKVHLRDMEKSYNFSLRGEIGIAEFNYANLAVPAVIMEKDGRVSKNFQATGSSVEAGNGQKSKGVIAVYNEYSSAEQPLVATTRFQTEDGKIFRLTKGIVVPGATDLNGKIQPGVIEAEVVADKSGEEYNIGASSFKIPGFVGGPKYEKIYAVSSKNMLGGSNVSDGEKNVVSKDDLEKVTKEAESELKRKLLEEISSEIGHEEHLFQESVIFSSQNSESAVASEKNGEFVYSLSGKIKVLVVSEKQLAGIVKTKIAAEENGKDFELKDLKIIYNKSEFDVEGNFIKFDIDARSVFNYAFDGEKFKKEVLGKNEEQVREWMEKNSQSVEGVEYEISPRFLTKKIPSFPQRVEVEVD